jgi:tRNA nucleotidyltransferase (CCA-adding enzyme)
VRASIERARADAPAILARLARARGRAAAYTSLVGVPEATVAWARVVASRPAARRHLDRYLRSWRRLATLATGDDIVALGVPAGPAVGALLHGLRAMQAAGKVRNRAGALRWLAGAVAGSRGRRESTAHPTG